jgi:predicted RNase H-like HicB family nuclease
MRTFQVLIERGEDGYYIGSVPALRGCHSQGRTIDELLSNIKEAIELCLDDDPEAVNYIPEFIGLQQVTV